LVNRSLKRAFANLTNPFDEMLAKIVQDRNIASPDSQDALVAAKQMHLNELPGGFGHPGHRSQLFPPDHYAS
jgi:hypothetical protein